MHTLLLILAVLAGIIILLLIVALFLKKDHYVIRSITIDAPRQTVFDYVKLLRNQDNFNKHAVAGGEREKTFTGTDGTVGYVYAWSGDKSAGKGEKEILHMEEGKKIEMEIRFTKPMAVSARIILDTAELPANKTILYWSNAGKLPYPFNLLIPVMERSVAKDMDSSLLTLKKILEDDSTVK